MKSFKASFLMLIISVVSGCDPVNNSSKKDTATVEPIEIADYGRALFSIDPMKVKQGLDSLSGKFHFFIGDDPDTLNVIQIRDFIIDPFNRELAARTKEVYPNLEFLEKELGEAFQNIKAVWPEFTPPRVYTYISGLLYESPVDHLDSVMIIGLDMFLGWDFNAYRAAGLPVYLTRRMEPQNIVPECARQVAISLMQNKGQPSTMLDHMLLHGKILFAMDEFLPGTADSLKIGYTRDQMEWCRKNEASIWRLFIDQEMLYQNDPFLNSRFIQDGPFTAGLPEGAPAMLGRYIGWQIIRSYMKKNPGSDLNDLFALNDSQQILSQSGYKPRK